MTTPDGAIAASYAATGAAWQAGPARVYDALADAMVAGTDADWAGRRVVDVGAGMGAASRAIARAGGRPLPADFAFGMLAAAGRRPAVQADARRLPFPARSIDGYVAAFCLNHLDDPAAALREAARVVTPGGPVVASAYAEDDAHPVKSAVDAAALARGWQPPGWAAFIKQDTAPRLATVDRARAVGLDAGLSHLEVEHLAVPFPDLAPADLVAWRIGMAQVAPFVAGLSPAERDDLVADALHRLGDPEPLTRRIIVLRAVA